MKPKEAWKIVKAELDEYLRLDKSPYIVPDNLAQPFYVIFRTEHIRSYGCDGILLGKKGSRLLGSYKGVWVISDDPMFKTGIIHNEEYGKAPGGKLKGHHFAHTRLSEKEILQSWPIHNLEDMLREKEEEEDYRVCAMIRDIIKEKCKNI